MEQTKSNTNKDITIILPLHEWNSEVEEYTKKAVNSVVQNTQTYSHGKLSMLVITPKNLLDIKQVLSINEVAEGMFRMRFIENDGNTEFCSQINAAVDAVETPFFSILEFDDYYTKNWFEMAHEYMSTPRLENVSIYLPINVVVDKESNRHMFGNEIAWASSFADEIGFITNDSLKDYWNFNLTGAIFNTQDFKYTGGFRTTIKLAFGYELLLRYTHLGLSVYCIPKEGYTHLIGRKGSLFNVLEGELSDDDIKKWFELAKIESVYLEDRHSTIDNLPTDNKNE